jgi:hypothetical protein
MEPQWPYGRPQPRDQTKRLFCPLDIEWRDERYTEVGSVFVFVFIVLGLYHILFIVSANGGVPTASRGVRPAAFGLWTS